MGGPDRPRGRAEQCGGEGLCLEEGGGVVVVVSGVVRAVREGVVDGGGGGCRDGRQVSGYDLRGQRLTLPLLTQRQLYLSERETQTQSEEFGCADGGREREINIRLPAATRTPEKSGRCDSL